jgi:hypothetical protein
MQYLKVLGHDSLVRDVSTGAIINTNNQDYQQYMLAKKAREQKDLQISEHAEDINNIKNEMQEIKSLILQLLNK